MSQIKLIVSDLDGSLLDSQGDLPKEVIQLINDIIDQGYLFTLATGRMYSSAIAPLDGLNLVLPIITLNGCYIAKPEISHQSIPNNIMEELFDLIASLEASVALIHKNNTYMKGEEYMPSDALRSWVSNIESIDTLQMSHCKETTLLLVNGHKDVISYFHKQSEKIIGEKADVFSYPSIRYPPNWFLEVRPKDTNKGTALKKLIDYLGIEDKSVLTIGDYYNDLEMFQHAGIKTAPFNAVDVIKEKADYISPKTNDEMAIIDIIGKFL